MTHLIPCQSESLTSQSQFGNSLCGRGGQGGFASARHHCEAQGKEEELGYLTTLMLCCFCQSPPLLPRRGGALPYKRDTLTILIAIKTVSPNETEGATPDSPLGFQEFNSLGLIGIYKSDWDNVGGANVEERKREEELGYLSPPPPPPSHSHIKVTL